MNLCRFHDAHGRRIGDGWVVDDEPVVRAANKVYVRNADEPYRFDEATAPQVHLVFCPR